MKMKLIVSSLEHGPSHGGAYHAAAAAAAIVVVLAELQCQVAQRLCARLHWHRLVVREPMLLRVATAGRQMTASGFSASLYAP